MQPSCNTGSSKEFVF